MIKNKYIIWNNKGGVGKSTLAFHIASTYADKYKDENILVIDMCPQANCTMMLLGSGTKGEGTLSKLEVQNPAQTIAGYISEKIKGKSKYLNSSFDWHVKVKKYNNKLPDNLYLIAGDGNLELLASPIAYYANAQFPTTAWRDVHKWIDDLIIEINNKDDKKVWTIFIDTNPSFAIYTELAMIASDKLIVPFNADDSSRHAVFALVRILYGVGKTNPVYDKFTFRKLAKNNKLSPPKCHIFIGNRFTQYKGSAAAFSALSKAVGEELYNIYKLNDKYFTTRKSLINNIEEFLTEYSIDVNDFNTAGVVSAHNGMLLKDLKDGSYDIFKNRVEIRKKRIKKCIESIDDIIKMLV